MSIEEKLTEAKGYVSRRWCKGALTKPGGSMCSLGALNKAFSGKAYILGMESNEQCQAEDLIQQSMRRVLGSTNSLVTMNDHPNTTKEQVVQSFEKAIARAGELGI